MDSPELGLEIAAALYKLYPDTYQIDRMDQHLLNKAAIDALKAGQDPRSVTRSGEKAALEQFKQGRAVALLYK